VKIIKKALLFIAGIVLVIFWLISHFLKRVSRLLSRIIERGLDYVFEKWD
jgi:hypothetical protein